MNKLITQSDKSSKKKQKKILVFSCMALKKIPLFLTFECIRREIIKQKTNRIDNFRIGKQI